MAIKKTNIYKVQFQEVQLKDSSTPENAFAFEFENHDNIFEIISKIQQSNILGGKELEMQLILGIKLFGDVMLRHKGNPLFESLQPAFIEFMKGLKAKTQQ